MDSTGEKRFSGLNRDVFCQKAACELVRWFKADRRLLGGIDRLHECDPPGGQIFTWKIQEDGDNVSI